jgi:hypothetical protein
MVALLVKTKISNNMPSQNVLINFWYAEIGNDCKNCAKDPIKRIGISITRPPLTVCNTFELSILSYIFCKMFELVLLLNMNKNLSAIVIKKFNITK